MTKIVVGFLIASAAFTAYQISQAPSKAANQLLQLIQSTENPVVNGTIDYMKRQADEYGDRYNRWNVRRKCNEQADFAEKFATDENLVRPRGRVCG